MPPPINLVIGTAWIVTGLVSLALALPLIAKRVGRNALYGVRFRESFESDEAWFAINHFGGQRLAWWSLPQIAYGVVVYFLPLTDKPGWTILAGVAPLAFILIPMLQAWRFARRGSYRGSAGKQV
jgi:hypothetical protein